MTITANLGFPRIGARRELKKALESYWKGITPEASLLDVSKQLRRLHWQQQQEAGINHIPSNDFSFYDQVLDTATMLGAIPDRYNHKKGQPIDLPLYFAMARGNQDVIAMEMTKWFDTNYHYLVPELSADTPFSFTSTKPIDEFLEAKTLGITTRPVLLGPVSFLLLSKMKDGSNRWDLLSSLLEVYDEVFAKLASHGASWIQIDEPCLVLDLDDEAKAAYISAYKKLGKSNLNLLLTTYFGDLRDNLQTVTQLPVAGLHVDLVRNPEQLEDVCKGLPQDIKLSLGVIDGRNIWKTDLEKTSTIIQRAAELRGLENLMIAPSCSLLHVPVDLELETTLDKEIKDWMAFAVQKLHEVTLLAQNANGDRNTQAFEENAKAITARKTSQRIHDASVKKRLAEATSDMMLRKSAFTVRSRCQQNVLNLPLLPTTTIGSYPQTAEVRQMRANYKKGAITDQDYRKFLEEETAKTIQWQDEIGLDVLVHGEFERNDMVEYFGQALKGFCFSDNGWVQSYGSRCVKPPIIYGDVSRPNPITVQWADFAQKQTDKPVKGMLTGPVTILQWSFVRDDQPRSQTCQQIAFAMRDEVLDLEKVGLRIIQIDEAALREGLPLRKADWQSYLDWAVESFKLTSCGVRDETQIHTHMCYSEFNDIVKAVAAMDADVISIETSRSQMELLNAFVNFEYPNGIGPGVYDIHSPRVPSQAEMEQLLEKALNVIPPTQLWVNPDCGLKTRGWAEVKPALQAMVEAAKSQRQKLQAQHKINFAA